ncbi:MAG: hypothetical protein KGJ86_16755 [Chloroflexota bacterium]|nr:hypothetical protein [Chloroflexota bacterium]
MGKLDAVTQALAAAQTLYHGPYLEDEPYAEWALAPRELLERTYQSVLLLSAEVAPPEGNSRLRFACPSRLLRGIRRVKKASGR